MQRLVTILKKICIWSFTPIPTVQRQSHGFADFNRTESTSKFLITDHPDPDELFTHITNVEAKDS